MDAINIKITEDKKNKGNKKDCSTTENEYKNDDIVHRFRFINQVPLNASNQDLLVNFVEYWQTTPKKTMHFSWVTDMEVTEENVFEIMRGGRARSQN